MKLFRPIHSGRIIARRSLDIAISALKEPPQSGPEVDDVASEGEVLHPAVSELVAVYNAARAQGLAPDPSWLKPNKDFRQRHSDRLLTLILSSIDEERQKSLTSSCLA